MIVSWVLFPLVLAGLGAGWGVLVEKAIGREVQGALLIPLGLLAALLAAALLTATKTTAPAAAFVVGAIAVAGLAIAWPGRRLSPWPLLAAIGVLLAYGAPILLSGQATFAGYNILDDTATWLGITDQMFTHARAVSVTPPSTYSNILESYLHLTGYPTGSFMLLGTGRGLTGADVAWVFQPYLACCGVLVGLCAYALFERFIASRPLRAGLVFIAAQPALLYGYSLWGGIKELTAAWILIAGVALLEPFVGRGAPKPRETLLLALPAAALVSTLGAGALVWIAPPLLVVAASWASAARRDHAWRAPLEGAGALVAATTLLALPALLVISTFLATDDVLFATQTGQPGDVNALGSLFAPLSPFQLAGIWPVGDFRVAPATVPTAILVAIVLAGAIGAIVAGVRRGRAAISLYVASAGLGVVAVAIASGSPWVAGKALTIGAPALLVAGLLGGALLIERSRAAGLVVCGCVAGGVLWSNALAYHDVRLAPRPRLAELQKIGTMIAGKGPTLLDEYEFYGTRHFLRDGEPASPGEHGRVPIALRGGEQLGSLAYADLDSFALGTLLRYRTIVTSRSPTQSRPPSSYRLVWQGRWYELWERPAALTVQPVLHEPGGDSNVLPFCGISDKGQRAPCSVVPASVAPCSVVRQIGALAARAGGDLVAFERSSPVVARASATPIPAAWKVDPTTGQVVATRPGTMHVRLRLDATGRYAVWLGGSPARAIGVSVDGRALGQASGLRGALGMYQLVSTSTLTRGDHTFALTYERGGWGPGDGGVKYSTLLALALDPLGGPPARMLDVAPAAAKSLCGRSLDWIEVVKPTTASPAP